MKLYLTTISIGMAVISALNVALGTVAWYYAVIATVWCTALQFAVDGSIAIIINRLPDAWFSVDKRMFYVSETERQLYKRLKVRRWKDKIWELGGLGGFSKKTFRNPDDPEYIEKFII